MTFLGTNAMLPSVVFSFLLSAAVQSMILVFPLTLARQKNYTLLVLLVGAVVLSSLGTTLALIGGRTYVLDLKQKRLETIQANVDRWANDVERFNRTVTAKQTEIVDRYTQLFESEEKFGLISKGLVNKQNNAGKKDMYYALVNDRDIWQKLFQGNKAQNTSPCSVRLLREDESITDSLPNVINPRISELSQCLRAARKDQKEENRAVEEYNKRVEVIKDYGGKIAEFRRIESLPDPDPNLEKIDQFNFNEAEIVYSDLIKNRIFAGEPVALIMLFVALLLDFGSITALWGISR
jgi:hypothetical protein